jgi:hypothetical protein
MNTERVLQNLRPTAPPIQQDDAADTFGLRRKRPLGRLRPRRKDDIKMGIKEIEREGVD